MQRRVDLRARAGVGLEQERYAFLIRPRRFGKSCWVALLESYYGTRAGRFEVMFGGTDIARRPTANRGRQLGQGGDGACGNQIEALAAGALDHARVVQPQVRDDR